MESEKLKVFRNLKTEFSSKTERVKEVLRLEGRDRIISIKIANKLNEVIDNQMQLMKEFDIIKDVLNKGKK